MDFIALTFARSQEAVIKPRPSARSQGGVENKGRFSTAPFGELANVTV